MVQHGLLLLLLSAAAVTPGESRANATSALSVFLLTECGECVKDEDSVFCTEAASDANFVNNGTARYTIAMKKQRFGAADGMKFCWEGTWGKMLRNSGNFSDILGSPFAVASLDCSLRYLYYRQCVISSELSIILIAIGGTVFLVASITIMFYCSCCMCCNVKGDTSKCGMCNRFCPWMPCADGPRAPEKAPEWVFNPVSAEENSKSLFGKSEVLSKTSAPAPTQMELSNLRKPSVGNLRRASVQGKQQVRVVV